MTRKESAEYVLKYGNCREVKCHMCFMQPLGRLVTPMESHSTYGICENCKYVGFVTPESSPLRAKVMAANYLSDLEETNGLFIER